MKILGITGGVGCGKSTVLEFFRGREDSFVLDADKAAHLLEEPGQICYEKIVAHFGKEILDKDGIIDRKKLGGIVFADEEQLKVLNAIVHPEVKNYIKAQIEEKRNSKKYAYFILEAALLLEEHYDKICDKVWYVYTSEENRRERLKRSRGYSDDKINQIMKNQLSESVFRQRTDAVIDNNGDSEDTIRQIREELRCLK